MKFLILFLLLTINVFGELKSHDTQGFVDINLVRNAGFENRLVGWSVSGGTLDVETDNPLFGKVSAIWDSGALGETLESSVFSIEDGMIGQTCVAFFSYVYAGSSGDYVARIVDDSDVAIISDIALPVATETKPVTLAYFDCDAATSKSYKIVLESEVTNADPIQIDKMFAGMSNNFRGESTEIIGRSTWEGATSCQWTRTASSFGGFSADTDCNTPVLTGRAVSVGSKIPAIKFDYLPAGKYKIEAIGAFQNLQSGTTACGFAFHDGVALSAVTRQSGSQYNTNGSVVGYFEYSGNQSDVTFEVQASGIGSSVSCGVESAVSSINDLEIIVTKFPTNSSNSITIGNSDWFVSANLSGSDFDLTIGTISSFTEFTNPSITLEKKTGSANVEIACANGTASSGTTCTSANESFGIVFEIPEATTYEICANFSDLLSLNAASTAMMTNYKWFETENDSTDVLQTGNVQVLVGNQFSAGSGIQHDDRKQVRLCDQFTFSSIGKKTMRVMRHQTATGTVLGHYIESGGSSFGGYTTSFTVRKIGGRAPSIISTNIQEDLDARLVTARKEKMCKFDLNMSSDGVSDDSGCVDSISTTSTGRDVVNFVSGFFSEAPTCFCSALIGSGDSNSYNCNITNNVTTSSLEVQGQQIAVGGTGVSAFNVSARILCISHE